MEHSFQKILIIQTAFIGDVILATALIEKIKAHFSEAEIDFLLRKGNESLLLGHPKLRNVLIWNKKEAKQKNLYRLIQQVRQENYDVVINVQRHLSTGLLTAFSGAKMSIGFQKNPLSFLFTRQIAHLFGDGTHEVERNQSLIKSFTDDQASKPKLYPSEGDFEQVRLYKRNRYVCIAPASVWFTKQYPREKWAELCNHLPKETTIYLLGAASDQGLCEWIKTNSEHPDIQILAGKISLLASAALMKDAVMNYVNDSAPMHLASAMNAPTSAVYCSTVPAFGYGPLADESKIIETSEPLPCRPCGNHGAKTCPEGHFKCAMGIKVEDFDF
jgi:heptosyltransferase-2